MKSYLRFAAQALPVFVIFCACSKKDNNSASSFTHLPGTYTITAMTRISPDGQGVSVLNDSLKTCQQDNLYVLNADNTFNYVDDGVQCDDSDGWDDVWTTENNDTRINLGGADYTIKSFSGSVLVLTMDSIQTVFTKKAN